jgi:hypothetical protein
VSAEEIETTRKATRGIGSERDDDAVWTIGERAWASRTGKFGKRVDHNRGIDPPAGNKTADGCQRRKENNH